MNSTIPRDTICPIRFIGRAMSEGLLDDRCQLDDCAMWNNIKKCCGLICPYENDIQLSDIAHEQFMNEHIHDSW